MTSNNEKIWAQISKIPNLPKDFIRKYWKFLNWDELLDHQKFDEKFIEEFEDRVNFNWHDIWDNECINYSEDFIERHLDKVIWDRVSAVGKLSEDFIRRHQDEVDWLYISTCQDLSEEFMREFIDKLSWIDLLQFQKNLSTNFIRELKDLGINIAYISSNENTNEKMVDEFFDDMVMDEVFSNAHLSEEWIRNFKGGKPWFTIIESQKLSDDFLEELVAQYRIVRPSDPTYIFKSILEWQNVSEDFLERHFNELTSEDFTYIHKELSEDFIRRHKNSLDWRVLCSRQKLSEKFVDEMKNFVDWDNLSLNASSMFSEQFIEKYKNKWNWSMLDYSQCSTNFIYKYVDRINKNTLYSNFNFVKKILKYEEN